MQPPAKGRINLSVQLNLFRVFLRQSKNEVLLAYIILRRSLQYTINAFIPVRHLMTNCD